MQLNIDTNSNISKGNIAYHEAILSDLQSYLKDNLKKIYREPANIIEKKENYLEQKQINSDNFQKLREQVANSEQLKEQLLQQQEENRLINIEKNNQDLINQELRLKLGDTSESKNDDHDSNLESAHQESKTENQILMDKLNLFLNNVSNKNDMGSFSSNVFDEHNKLLMNKRMSDIDEKLYDLTRKLNSKELTQPSGSFQNYPFFPMNLPHLPNPFQQVSNNNSYSNNGNQNQENPFQQLSNMNSSSTNNPNQNEVHSSQSISPQNTVHSKSENQQTSIEDNEHQKEVQENKLSSSMSNSLEDSKYNHLIQMINNLDKKYTELTNSKDNIDLPKNISPITVNINNDKESFQTREPISTPKEITDIQLPNQNKEDNNERTNIQSPYQNKEDNNEKTDEDDVQYDFGPVSNPFDYIYNDTDDIIFEKKPVLLGGNKIEKFKRLRKLKI